MLVQPEDLPQPPFETVPFNRAAEPSAEDQAQPADLSALRARADKNENRRMRQPPARFKNTLEIPLQMKLFSTTE
jgi:hypothetical protein